MASTVDGCGNSTRAYEGGSAATGEASNVPVKTGTRAPPPSTVTSYSQQPGTPAAAPTTPTLDGAAQGYASDPLQELKNDPAYRELQEELALLARLEGSHDYWDKNYGNGLGGGKGDGYVNWSEISDAANAGDPAAQEFMKYKRLFDEATGGHTLLSASHLHALIDSRRAAIKTLEDQARAAAPNASTSQPAGATRAGASGGTSGAPGGTEVDEAKDKEAIRAEMNNQNPKPPPSTNKGLEGASENVNNMVGWVEGEIDRLTTLMAKTDDPGLLKELENKINQLSRRAQQLSALMNQIMTMLSNISKMYSDIAMNAIRNMK